MALRLPCTGTKARAFIVYVFNRPLKGETSVSNDYLNEEGCLNFSIVAHSGYKFNYCIYI